MHPFGVILTAQGRREEAGVIFKRTQKEPAKAPPREVRGEKAGTWWVIAPTTETIDYDTADAFRREVLACIEAGRRRIAIDMRTVRLVDSMGLGALVAIRRKLEANGEIRLFGLSVELTNFFAITKTQHLFPAYPSLQALLAVS